MRASNAWLSGFAEGEMGRRIVVAMVAAVWLAVLPARAADQHVHVQEFAFSPQAVSILIGEQADWDNHDGVIHTVTSDDGRFDSGVLGSGGTFSVEFSNQGGFPYHCEIHPSMTGTVNVVDPNAPDLVVDSVTVTDNGAFSKQVDAVVRNAGASGAGASVLRLAYRTQGQLRGISDQPIGPLAAGATQAVSVTWDVTGKIGDFPVEAIADVGGAVVELSETNNIATTTTSVLVPGIPGIDLLDPL